MRLSLIVLLVIVLLVVLAAGFVVMGFNKLRRADIATREALGGIDRQLTRRADLVPHLVETVKGYAAHERGTFEEVTRARAQVATAASGDDVAAKASADGALQNALVQLNTVVEAYPDLLANTSFLDLQRQLAEIEGQLAFARQHYNDAVSSLENLTQTVPWMFLTGVAGVGQREFYDAPEGQEAPPRVGS